MGKLHNDIPKLLKIVKIIEQYNNFKQLGAEEDIEFLKEKIINLYNIKDTLELIKNFSWCVKVTNMFYDEIDTEFKKSCLAEERKRVE